MAWMHGNYEPPDRRLGPVNEATPAGHCAVEAACVHRLLDERGVPRHVGPDTLTLWGRVLLFAESKKTVQPQPKG